MKANLMDVERLEHPLKEFPHLAVAGSVPRQNGSVCPPAKHVDQYDMMAKLKNVFRKPVDRDHFDFDQYDMMAELKNIFKKPTGTTLNRAKEVSFLFS